MVKTLWEKEQEERERKRLKDAARLQSFLTNKPANKTAGQAQPTAKAAINAQPRIYDSSVKQASPQYYKRDNVQEDAISRQAERLQAKAADLDWQRTRGGLSPAKQQELGRKQRLAQVAYDNFQDNNSQAAWLKTIRDVGSIQADIDRIQAQRYKLSEQRAAQAAGQERTRAYSPNSGIGGMQKSTEDQISALAKQLDLLKDERDVARYVQYFVDIPNRQDFVSRSAPRVNFGNDDPTYRQINGLAIPDWRVTSDPMAAAQAMEGFDTQWAQANRENSQMTDEERKIYNYLYAEAGSAAAEEFLDYIRDPLNRRLAGEMAQAYAGNGVFGRIEQGLDAALAGGEQFFTGIGNSFRSEPTSPSARQYAYQFGREDASAGGRLALDALYTAGNMAPGILLSTVAGGIAGAAGATAGTAATIGSAAGNTAMGLSAAGNAYAEKIRAGYDEGEARSYSILVGASEALLQRLLGGISSLGGKAGNVARRIDAIDGAFWRASGQLGLSMAKEGSEEALQAILEPLFAKLILDEDASPEVVGEIAYSYLMGALMGGIFDAGPAIRRGLNPEPVALTGGIGARRPVGLMGGVGEQRPILGEQPYLPNADFLPGERTRSQQGEVPGVDISDLFRAQSGGSVYQPGPQADDSINLDMAEQGDSGARQDDLLEALLGLREEQRQRQQQVSDGDWEDEDAIWGDILYVPGQLINTELEGEFPDASLQRLFDDSDDAAIQSEVDAYVDHAIAKSKYVENPLITNEDLDNLLIGAVSPELAEEIWRFYGVDISNKTHVLNDNDLRHIYNHHGPHTNEKYPVTKKDLKAIPKIIKNYGDVYYIPRDDGKTGIVYLYRHNGVTYYLEQIADGNILSNKQMIKVPTGKIPDIPGIEEAIKKKQSLAPDAAGNAAQKAANAGPRMYVPDVKDSVSAASIAKPEAAVKGNELLEALLPDYARGPENSRKTQNVLRPDREVKLADPFMDIWLPETVEMLGLDLAGIKRDKKTLREMRKQYEIEAGLTPESIFFAGQYGNVSNKPGDYRLGQAPPSGISGLLYPARRDRRRQAIKAQRETAAAVLVPALEYDQRSLIAAANANKVQQGIDLTKAMLGIEDAPQPNPQPAAVANETAPDVQAEAAGNQSMLEALLGMELDPQGTGKAEKPGLLRNAYSRRRDARTMRTVDSLAQYLDVSVELVPPGSLQGSEGQAVDGLYDPADSRILIDAESSNPLWEIIKHEFAHRVRDLAPDEFAAYGRYVLQEVSGVDSAGKAKLENAIRIYQEGGQLSLEGAAEEFLADFNMNLLGSEAAIRKLCRENMSLGQRMLEWVKDMLAAVRASIQFTMPEAEYKPLNYGLEETQLELAEQYFTDALRAANRNLGAQENAALEPGGVRYKFVGTRSDGIEVYETSEEVSNLSKKQRQEAFLLLMQKDYLGRTAKFTTRSGQTYYAKFDETDIRKNIYGDKKSDRFGYNAKVNTGADGNIFELVENAKHDGGKPETGKKTAAHRNVGDWDYFVKTVQIDGKVYDLLANVRKKPDGEYVYSIQLTENKNKASAPPSRQTSGYVSVAGHLQTRVGANASNQSLTDNTTKSQYQSSGALDSSLSDTRSSRPDLRESALAAWNSAAAPETQAETARGPETAPGTPSPETEEAVNEGEKDPTELDNYREMVAEIEAGDAAYGRLKISETTAKALTDKGVSGFKDIDRNIEAALKGTEDAPEVAAEIKEKIIDPLFSAKAARAAAVRKNLKRVKSIVGETGVKKRSRESAAVQWYGEGFRTDEYGKRHAYGEVDLRREFPEKAEKIMACAQQLRAMYDEYIDRINAVLERIYPDPVGYAQREVERLQANARYYEGQARIMQEAGNADGAAQMKGEAESFWKRAARKQKDIDSGDVLRNKRLQKRQDYFHHFQEMSDGLGGLKNILSAPHEIDPRLVGKSEGTKPKSRWAGFMQRRGEGPYQADAIGGMLEYILAAEHKIAFDPVIADLRSITRSIAEATKKTRNCNGLIQWLTDFANDLAGKTNPFVDRLLIRSTNGRKWMKFFQWLNRRGRANQVTLSPRSAIAQFFNIQNAWNNMADARDWIRGATLYARSLMKDSPERQLLEKSGFLSERWLDRELRGFDSGIAADINKFSSWMMESGDKISTEMIWCVALAKGQREGIKGTDALVDYADHLTLKSVGGRGVGEAPLNMKAEFTKTIFPFQLEVNNQWQNMKENLRSGDAKAIGRMIASSVVGYLMNEPLRQLFGFDVGFDPINALLEGLEAWNDEEDEDKTASSFLQDVGGRFAGEIIGAAPGGAQILSMILPDDDVRESIFGEGDPTRYGTGNLGLNILTEPVAMAIQGKDFSDELLSSMLGILPPIGGRQAERIIQGVKNATGFEPELSSSGGFKMKDQAPGASYTVNGNLRFPIHNDPGNLLMSMLFGPYSTREGKQYIEDGSKALSQKETAFYNAAVRGGMEGQEALELIRATKDDLSPWQLEKVLAESSDPDMAASFILQRNEKTWAMAQRLNRPGMSHVGYAEYAAFRAHTQGGNREQVMSYLRNSDLYIEQKEALYSAEGFSGDYGNWERAYEELVGKNAAFSALSLTEQNKVLDECLQYEPGTDENSKVEAALLAGWTLGEYYTMKASTGKIRADKDKDGDSVSGSRKKKVLEYLDESSLSLGQQGVYLLLTENWKLSNEMIRAAGKYILSLNCTEEQRAELADLCSFVVNPDGTLTYERRK